MLKGLLLVVFMVWDGTNLEFFPEAWFDGYAILWSVESVGAYPHDFLDTHLVWNPKN